MQGAIGRAIKKKQKTMGHIDSLIDLPLKISKNGKPDTYLLDVIERIKSEEGNLRRMKMSYSVLEKLKKMRAFLKDKKNERLEDSGHITNLKFFEIILFLAQETIDKMKINNLIDHTDIGRNFNDFVIKDFRNFSINSKRQMKNSKNVEVDAITEEVRLDKILDQFEKGSSGYVQSVKDLFTQTADLYFTNIRPSTPILLKSKDPLTLRSYNKKIEKLDQKLDRVDRLTEKHYSQKKRDMFGRGVSESNLSPRTKKVQFRDQIEVESSKKMNEDSEPLAKLASHSHAKSMRNSISYASLKTKGFYNATFNTRIRYNNTERGQLDKYQFYKEKRFLNFMKNSKWGNKASQEKVKSRLDYLVYENKNYESEREELLNKLKRFNPIQIKEISTYLEQTEKNKVLYKLRSRMRSLRLYAQRTRRNAQTQSSDRRVTSS